MKMVTVNTRFLIDRFVLCFVFLFWATAFRISCWSVCILLCVIKSSTSLNQLHEYVADVDEVLHLFPFSFCANLIWIKKKEFTTCWFKYSFTENIWCESWDFALHNNLIRRLTVLIWIVFGWQISGNSILWTGNTVSYVFGKNSSKNE